MSSSSEDPPLARLRRRLLTLTLYPLAFLALAVLLPLLLPLALLRDLVLARRFATTRCLLFIATYLACELAGISAAVVIGVAAKVQRNADLAQARYYRLQWWWARTLFGALTRLYDLRFSVNGVEDVDTARPLIVLMRHTSMADTLLPSVLLSSATQLRLRYILKRELLWDPCLDLVGNQIPNVFVRRSSGQTAGEVQRVAELARSMRAGDGALVYPEGTRFSLARRAKILEQLEREGGARLEASRALRHVLPPRRGGTLALLDAAPDADIVVCVHEGLERVTGFDDLISGDLVGATVDVAFWTVPRASVPLDADGRAAWLDALWARVDAWVDERIAARSRQGLASAR